MGQMKPGLAQLPFLVDPLENKQTSGRYGAQLAAMIAHCNACT